MTQGQALRETARIVEVLEEAGVAVEDVSVTAGGDEAASVGLQLRLPEESLTLPVRERGGADARGGTGGATPDGATGPDSPAGDASDGVADEPPDDARRADGAGTGPSGAVPCPVDACEETFGSDHGMKIHVAKSHGDDENTPAHRNPERLAEVYERHDTFDEMRDALAVDVTAQTVRRNMMKHGIHDPEEDDPADAADPTDATSAADPSGDADGAPGEDPADGSPAEGGPAEESRTAATDGGAGALAANPGDPDVPPAGNGRDDGAGGPALDAGDDVADEAADETGGDPAAEADSDVTAEEGTDGADGASGAADEPGNDPAAALAGLSAADMDLPGDVAIEEFVEVVAEARTLFDVQRALELDRSEAQSLLAELGLLEFVHGRVAEQERCCETPYEAVAERLRERVDPE